jgi:type 1 glutamine amidotransferase
MSKNEHGLTRRSWLGACAVAASQVRAQTPEQSGGVRVLLVTGGHAHEISFYSVFEGREGMKINVDPHPAVFRTDPVPHYDVIVFYDLVQLEDTDERRRKNLQKFAESGKGIVVLHHALCSYNAWEWWWRDLAGARYLEKPDGSQPASTYKHGEKLKIVPVGSHPVLSGIDAMEMVDETYKGMWMSTSNKVLLKTDNPTSDGPVAWVSSYEKSRVVAIQLGHGREAHLHPGYRRLVGNAVFWAAGVAKA